MILDVNWLLWLMKTVKNVTKMQNFLHLNAGMDIDVEKWV